MGPAFQTDSFQYSFTNSLGLEITIYVNQLGILSDGTVVILDGMASWAGFEGISITNLALTRDGVDFTSGAQITDFAPVIHGWTVNVLSADFLEDRIRIHQGQISLPGVISVDRDIMIEGLEIGYQNAEGQWPVLTPGYTQSYEAEPFSFVPMEYQNPVEILQFGMTEQGLMATEMLVSLPGLFEERKISFTNSLLTTSGLLSDSDSLASFSAAMGEFTLNFIDSVFSSTGIVSENVDLELLLGDEPVMVSFSDSHLRWNGLAETLETEASVDYGRDGWDFEIISLNLGNSGLQGQGVLLLPETLGGTFLVFDEVHRLLEKYGGKGGYVALEKACREFRKWGIGLIMVSQVSTDFKEAVAGNIMTEVQLNTKSMDDIKRIAHKYGVDYSSKISRQL